MSTLTLNQTHKAGLFLVIVAAGVSLFFEASAKQTAGIVLLRLAGTWLFGSLRPQALALTLASIAACIGIGIGLAILPVWKDWSAYRASIGEYDVASSKFRDDVAHAVRSEKEGQPVTIQTSYPVLKWLRPEFASKFDSESIEDLQTYTLHVNWSGPLTEQDILDLRGIVFLPRPSFSWRGVIHSHLPSSVGGSLLLLFGLLALIPIVWQVFKRKPGGTASNS